MLMKSIFGRTNLTLNSICRSYNKKSLSYISCSNFSSIFTTCTNNNLNPSFYSDLLKHFSSEKLKLKEQIQIVDTDSLKDENEDWGEILFINLDKENYNKFDEQIKYISRKDIVLSLTDTNKILSAVYNKNVKVVDTIYNYICDKNIHLDSISYYYLIVSFLQFKNFQSAFEFFFQASMLNIPQNLSVIIALYKEINFLENEEDKIKFQAILDEHVRKHYPEDVIE